MPGENPSTDSADVLAESLERVAAQLADPRPGPLEPRDIREGEVLPGEGEQRIEFGDPKDREAFTRELGDICDAYDTATESWRRRQQDINRAYNLVPDPTRAGQTAHAQRLVSEATRANVNVAAARIIEGVMGVEPFMSVQVSADQAEDADTQERVREAQKVEDFFESYGVTDMEAESWMPLAFLRLVKSGAAIVRALWHTEERPYYYADKDNQLQRAKVATGRIKVDLIRNENVIAWPVWEPDPDKLLVIGHRSPLVPAQVREWARRKKIAPEVVERLIAYSKTGLQQERDENLVEDLKDKDIDISGANPFEGEIWITELWGRTTLPGKEDDGPVSWLAFFAEGLPLDEALLWLGYNTLRSQRAPYFKLPYWQEDAGFWSTGVGQEIIYQQAADTALQNLQIDNLKQTANHLRILKAGTMAEDMSDQIAPGFSLVTEEPGDDVRIESLGGDLSHIYQAMDRNDLRAMKVTGITSPIQGFGDPVLKSGASPSSLGMLIESAGKKFGQVDRNIRNGLSKLYFHCLELLQQYAPDGVYYDNLDAPGAELLIRRRFLPPRGDLRKIFRIKVRAPSANSTRTVLTQQLMIAYNLWVQHVQALLMLADQAFGQDNQARVMLLKKEALRFTDEIFKEVIKNQDVPGLTGKLPRIRTQDEETAAEETINALAEQIMALQGELQQMQQAMQPPQQQGAPGAGIPGAGMGNAGAGPQLPGAGVMPQGV